MTVTAIAMHTSAAVVAPRFGTPGRRDFRCAVRRPSCCCRRRQKIGCPMKQRCGCEYGLRAVGVRPDEAVEVEPGQHLEQESPSSGDGAERSQRKAEGAVVANASQDPLEELGGVGYRPPGVQALLIRGGLESARGGGASVATIRLLRHLGKGAGLVLYVMR